MKAPLIHIVLYTFLFNIFTPNSVIASEAKQSFYLPKPGVMVHLSPEFNPPVLKGLKVHPNNPFKFDFILDQGDSPKQEQLKSDANRLIKYFLASLTVPEKDLWVNLSPYEKDRIVPESFGQTEMGRDLLAQDYLLKQITASLIYPEGETGKKFWDKIYQQAQEKFGTTEVPINTFNKVWIIPEKAVVYENAEAGTAYVVESKLKVMLEEDYMSLSHAVIPERFSAKGGSASGGIRESSALGSQVVRDIVIPELTKEVNEGKNFAQLRQVYQSLILATWYKKKIKDSILTQVYADKNKIVGLVIPAKAGIHVEAIYQQYLTAFKKGVFNYIKDPDPNNVGSGAASAPRKYFSGGFDFSRTSMDIDGAMTTTQRMPDTTIARGKFVARVNLSPIGAKVKSDNLISDVQPIIEPATPITRKSDLDRLVEEPLLVAARHLYDLNIQTSQASANVRDIGFRNATLRFYYDGLSERNKRVVKGIPQIHIEQTDHGKFATIAIPIGRKTTVQQVQAASLVIVKRFYPQLLTWGFISRGDVIKEAKEMGEENLSEDVLERVAKIMLNLVLSDQKLFYDSQGKIYYASEELMRKAVDVQDIDFAMASDAFAKHGEEMYKQLLPKMEKLYGAPWVPQEVRDDIDGWRGFMGQISVPKAMQEYMSAVKEYGAGQYKDKSPEALEASGKWYDVFNNQLSAVFAIMDLSLMLGEAPDWHKDRGTYIQSFRRSYAMHYLRDLLVQKDPHKIQEIADEWQRLKSADTAQIAPTGGIDLTAQTMPLQVKDGGEAIKFDLNPAMLKGLQNAAGFIPVIIDIKPLVDLPLFLGASSQQSSLTPP